MSIRNASVIVLGMLLAVAVWPVDPVDPMGQPARVQAAPPQSAAAPTAPKDDYQRSEEIYSFRTTAKSGAQRGEELYYYKCWFCHNQFAKTGPQLGDLYKRGTFGLSGEPVNDQTLAEKIRKGGPAMPAYGAILKDSDIADLVSYIRDGHCCFDSQNPPLNPRYLGATAPAAGTASRRSLSGGARGLVHDSKGDPLEGIGVQLISTRTAIRTTVYTSQDGRYEFPVLEAGLYTLRVPLPREFQPFVKESVRIDGPTHLDDIVLQPVSETEFLPPKPEILAQLTGAEWLLNIPGSGEEKRVFSLTCGFGCHSYQQVFRNRYDEASWRVILRRMTRGAGSPLINMANPTPASLDRAHRSTLQDEEFLAKWLARVRGPESKDEPLSYLPRPRGASTRVVITEYELPRELLAPHDVHGDSHGNIWYTAHRSPYAGVLDPHTGAVKEYRIPGKEQDTPDVLPGTHRVWVDKNDIVWFSENWDHYLTALDPKTGQIIHRFAVKGGQLNSSAFSNFAMDDQGYVYDSRGDGVTKIDSRNGEVVQRWTYKEATGGAYQGGGTYDSIITPDGRYWSGGTTYGGLVLDTKTGKMTLLESGFPRVSSGSRGAFDSQENAWFGGRGGMLIKMDPKALKITEYQAPVQYETFYEALPDKNGEVWAGGLQSARFMRFNPKTEAWTQYMMPEPYAHDRRTWIDNSTDPVTVWYVDQEGYIVRIQPLE